MFEARRINKDTLPLGICKRHRSFFTTAEDQFLLKIKIVSTALADGILGVKFPYYSVWTTTNRSGSWGNTGKIHLQSAVQIREHKLGIFPYFG